LSALAAVTAIAALALAFIIPDAHAQGQAQGITVTVGKIPGLVNEDNYQVVPYMGNITVPVNVTVGCGTLAQHAASMKVTVAVSPLPAWLVDPPVVYDFTPSASFQPNCVASQGYASISQNVPLSFKKEAPGIVAQQLHFVASMADNGAGDKPSSEAVVPVQVQFHPDYTITPSVQFPLAVTGQWANFTVTITNRGNAPSMVMIEEMQQSTGALGGIGPEVYDPPAHNGSDSKVFNVHYKAPATWSTATVTFKAFSHFLINPGYGAGGFKGEQDVKWTFTNAGGPTECNTTTCGTTTKAPLPMLPLYVIVLAGAALVARRRA